MAQHRDASIDLLIVTHEIPAKHGADAEHTEKIRGNNRRGKLPRIANAGEGRATIAIGRNGREGMLLRPPIEEIGIAEDVGNQSVYGCVFGFLAFTRSMGVVQGAEGSGRAAR